MRLRNRRSLTMGDFLRAAGDNEFSAWGGVMAESWRLTERDRRGAWTAAAAVASTFFGPFAPAVMWGFDYVYDRRDLIFYGSCRS